MFNIKSKYILIFWTCIFLSIIALACMKKKESSKNIEFIELYKGNNGTIEPEKILIKDNNSLLEFEKKFVKNITFNKEEIDFEKHMIIGICLGIQDTNKFTVNIKKMILKENKIFVYYYIGEVAKDDEFLIKTYPIHIVRVNRMPQSVLFSNEDILSEV